MQCVPTRTEQQERLQKKTHRLGVGPQFSTSKLLSSECIFQQFIRHFFASVQFLVLIPLGPLGPLGEVVHLGRVGQRHQREAARKEDAGPPEYC